MLGVLYPPAAPGVAKTEYLPGSVPEAIARGENYVLFYDPISSAESGHAPIFRKPASLQYKKEQPSKRAPKSRLKAGEAVIHDLIRLSLTEECRQRVTCDTWI